MQDRRLTGLIGELGPRHASIAQFPDQVAAQALLDPPQDRTRLRASGVGYRMLGEETFHPDTRALLGYGRALAGIGAAPPNSGAAGLAGRLFVVDRMTSGRLQVRTFGADLITLFGTDLRDTDWQALFLQPDQVLLAALIAAIEAANQPGVSRLIAETEDHRRIGAELLLTPLRTEGQQNDRLLGLFQPLGGETLLQGRPLKHLKLGALHPPFARPPAPAAGLKLVVNNE